MTADTDTALPGRSGTVRRRVGSFADDHPALVLLGPPIAVILAVFVYPVVWMVAQSLYVSFPGLEPRFAPLYNYQQMLSSDRFWQSFGRTLVYSFGSLALSFTGGLVVALAINRVRRRLVRTTYTTLIMFSWAIPLAVVALMWKWILVARPYGLANRLLLDLGLIDAPISFLSEASHAMLAVTLADGWLRMPFAMILFLAGLQSIPRHRYEAALVDGADALQRFRAVTLPALRPYMAIVGLINWMFAFRAFSIVYPMTEGGPGTGTTTLAVEIYETGMTDLNFGYGSAMAVFLVAITLVLAVFYVRIVLGRLEE